MDNKKIIVYVDMDGVLCDFRGEYNEKLKKTPEIKYPQSQFGFFMNLKPLLFATSSYHLLDKHFDTRILTSPSAENPMCYMEKRVWVEKHLGIDAAKKMIIAPDKSVVHGNYLIDDLKFSDRSKQQDFTGKLIHFGGEEFIDWGAVVQYFIKTYGL